MSPYIYCANNPVLYVDPDGREPIPSYRRWLGEPRKAWQWYSKLLTLLHYIVLNIKEQVHIKQFIKEMPIIVGFKSNQTQEAMVLNGLAQLN